MAIGAIIFFWPITLWIAEKSYFTTDSFELSAVIIAIICNLMSVTTILGRSNIELLESMDLSQAVGAINSIYLVLSTFPFVFLISNNKLKFFLLILPIMAFIMSGKTTCIASSLLCTAYFFFSTIMHSNSKIKIFMMVIIVFYVIFYIGDSFVNFGSLLEGISLDLDSGGNGRINIIKNVLTHYMNKGIINQILGSGFFAVATDTKLSAHNDFLEVLYDYGVVGLILFLVFWYQLIKKRKQQPSGTNIHVVYDISLIIYICSCLASNFIVQQINMLFFALLWGTIDKYPIISKKQIL